MSSGYFCLPRSLTRDPIWMDLTLIQQKVFLIILDHVCFKTQKHDDHGTIMELKPGQICTTIRKIVEWCNSKEISKNDVERSIKKLFLCDFLRQEVRHTKSIITITHKDTYELILRSSETGNETTLRQDRDKIETEKKNEKKEKKEKNNILHLPSVDGSSFISEKNNDSNERLIIHSKVPSKTENPTFQKGIELSQFFYELILSKKSNFKKPNIQNWAKHIDSMLRLDNRNEEEIRSVMRWINQDDFEFANVLCTSKLRTRFESLQAKSNQKKIPQKNSNVIFSKKIEEQLKGHKIYTIYAAPTYLEIRVDSRNLVKIFKYEENGFQDQVRLFLEKCGLILAA